MSEWLVPFCCTPFESCTTQTVNTARIEIHSLDTLTLLAVSPSRRERRDRTRLCSCNEISAAQGAILKTTPQPQFEPLSPP
jgi:hypothetical protein